MKFSPNTYLFAFGLFVMILGPTILVKVIKALFSPYSSLIIGSPWSLGALVFFIAGWIIIGASLRPQQSILKGILFSFILYSLIGIVFLFFMMSTGGSPDKSVFDIIVGKITGSGFLRNASLLLIRWPLGVVGILEYLGVGILGIRFGT